MKETGLIGTSFLVIKKNPKLVFFPIISFVLMSLVFLSFLIPSNYIPGLSLEEIDFTLIFEFNFDSFENSLPLVILFIY